MTTSQRARLILSLGVLNIVLATIALGIGGVELQQRAIASGGPSQVAIVPTAPPSGGSTPTEGTTQSPTTGETPAPTPSGSAPTPSSSPNPSTAAASHSPTSAGASTPAIGSPVAPVNPATPGAPSTPRPTQPSATSAPTSAPTAAPTAQPTRKPTPAPSAASGGKPKARPPCPSKGGTPPGHAKTDDPHTSCGGDKGNGGAKNGGIVLVLPLLAASVGWVVRPERLRPRRRAR